MHITIPKKLKKLPFARGQKIILLCLMLMAVNFGTRFYYFAFAAFGLLPFFSSRKQDIPIDVIPLVILALFLSIFSPAMKNSILGIIKSFAYPIVMLVGFNLVDSRSTQKAEQQVVILIITMAIGTYAHYLLNMLYNIGSSGTRNTIDFWTRSVLSATGQAALACLMIGCAAAVMFISASRTVKTIALMILISIVIYNTKLAGRTIFVQLALALCTGFIIHFTKLKNARKRIRLLVGTAIVALILVILLLRNTFGIMDALMKSNWGERFFGNRATYGLADDGRFFKKLMHISMMADYPWGGAHIRKYAGYAHDIVLDTYDEAGLFAMISVIAVLWSNFGRCRHVWKSAQISSESKVIIVTVMVVLMCEFMVEPILQGMPWLMTAFCTIYGGMCRLSETIRLQR